MSETKIERPEFVTDQHLAYLDELRGSGITNMFGATSFLFDRFEELRDGNLRSGKAWKVLCYWMNSFGKLEL